LVTPSPTPIAIVNWGPGSFSSTSSQTSSQTAWTAGAYLSSQYLPDGTSVSQQEIWLEAYDNSGYDTPWIKVTPDNLMITLAAQNANRNGVGMYLYIPHSFRVLTSPTVWYKTNATTQALMSVGGTTDDGYTTSIPLGGTIPDGYGQQMVARPNQGGYYSVQLSVNKAAVAGIVVGAVVLVAIICFVYWKIRIQPAGGFQAWLREKKAMYTHSKLGDTDPLVTGTTSTELSAQA